MPKPHTATKRCAIYTRVSTLKQVQEEGGSLETQLNVALEFIRNRKWEFAEEYRDSGISGTHDRRPEFQRMLADAEAHKFNTVVFQGIDRVARDLEVFREAIKRLEKSGVEIFALDSGQISSHDASGWLVSNLQSLFAEQYSVELSRKMRRAQRAKALQGSRIGAPPLGYTWNDVASRCVPDPVSGALVVEVFNRIAAGEAPSAISHQLNARGFRTPKKIFSRAAGPCDVGGKLFSADTIFRIIANPFYSGTIRLKRKNPHAEPDPAAEKSDAEADYYRGTHVALVSPETAQAAKHALEHNPRRRERRAADSDKGPFLLRKLIRCGCCDVTLIPCWTRKPNNTIFLYYRCPQRVDEGSTSKCNVGQVSAPAMDLVVCSFCSEVARRPEVVDGALAAVRSGARDMAKGAAAERTQLNRQRSEATAQLRNCIDLLAVQGSAALTEELTRKVEALKLEQVNLIAKIAALPPLPAQPAEPVISRDFAMRALGNFASLIEHLPIEKRRIVVRAFVREVSVKRIISPAEEWIERYGKSAHFWKLHVRLQIPEAGESSLQVLEEGEGAKAAAVLNYEVIVALPDKRAGSMRVEIIQPVEMAAMQSRESEPQAPASTVEGSATHPMQIALEWERALALDHALSGATLARRRLRRQ